MKIVTLIFALQLGASCLGAEMRQWTSSDGRSMWAELIAREGERITIRRDDGTIFTVGTELFSSKDRQYVKDWVAPEIPVPELNDAVFIIQAGENTGSGFLLQDRGQIYLYTNQHVIQGHERGQLKAVSAGGRQIELGELQIIPDQDIARIRVKADGGLKLAPDAKLDEAIRAIGNSGGAGVLTINKGKINGLGSGLVEVTADIIPGNSGGPILNEASEVVGIATFVAKQDAAISEDWKIKGTRYAGTRRFGLRLLPGMTWRDVEWERYTSEGRVTKQLEADVVTWFEYHRVIFTNPSSQLNSSDEMSRFLREVAEEQNENARRFNAKIGNTVNQGELDRMNRYENRKLSQRIEANVEDLLRHIETRKRANGGIETPYFLDQFKRNTELVKGFRDILEKEMNKPRTFFRFN